jgi:hypothetical protein
VHKRHRMADWESAATPDWCQVRLLRLGVTASPNMHMYYPLGIHTASMIEVTDVIASYICITRGVCIVIVLIYVCSSSAMLPVMCMGHVIPVPLRGTEVKGYIGHAHLGIVEVSSSGGQTSVSCLTVISCTVGSLYSCIWSCAPISCP